MPEEENDNRFEMTCGLTLAVFAAVLAITDLGGGKYGGDELIAVNEKASAYAWYSSKSVKETLVEGQRDTLKMLLETGAIAETARPGLEQQMAALDADANRYGKEKKEILLGSDTVGEENWAQDVDGEMGKIVGATDWQALADGLGSAGDVFDYSTLFLQMCMVMGAISLVVQEQKLRWAFFGTMVAMGGLGSAISVMAFRAAWAVL